MVNPIDSILDLLACPCPLHGKLQRQAEEFVSECCGRRFRIEDGIPVLLIQDEADHA